MENHDKAQKIRRWIDPEERVTVNFSDQWNLNGEVIGCTDEVVHLALETTVPHMRQAGIDSTPGGDVSGRSVTLHTRS